MDLISLSDPTNLPVETKNNLLNVFGLLDAGPHRGKIPAIVRRFVCH
jgi:hypothetical protein